MPFLGESQGTLSNLWGNPGEISDFPTDLQKFSGRAVSRPQVSRLLDSGSSSQQELPDSSVTARAGLGGSWSMAWGCRWVLGALGCLSHLGLHREQGHGLGAEGRWQQGQAAHARQPFQQQPEPKWAKNNNEKTHSDVVVTLGKSWLLHASVYPSLQLLWEDLWW